MNRISLLRLTLLLVFTILASCSKETNEVSDEIVTINFLELAPEVTPSVFAPISVMEKDGSVLIHYYNPEDDGYDTIEYHGKDGQSITILLSDNRIVFSDCKVASSKKITLASLEADEGFATLYVVEHIINTEQYEVIERIPLTKATKTRARVEEGDDIRRIIKEKLLDRIGDDISNYWFIQALDAVTLGRWHVSDFAGLIGYIASMSSEMVLMDGAGTDFIEETLIDMADRQASIYTGKIAEYETGKLFKLKYNRMMTDFESTLSKAVIAFTKKGMSGVLSSIKDISLKEADEYTENVYMKKRRLSFSMQPSFSFDRDKPYELTVDVFGITTKHATFSGSCSYLGNGAVGSGGPELAVIEMGFKCLNKYGESYSYPSDNLKSIVAELKPASTYWVQSYIKTMSGTFDSSFIKFRTKGTGLSINPNSISSLSEGGDYSAVVTVGDDIKWRIIEKPSWCTITSNDNGNSSGTITFHIDKTNIERSGVLTVQASSYDNGNIIETETASITITQTKTLSWDGTSWVFTWPAGCKYAEYGNYDITVKSVSRGIYESFFEAKWTNAGLPASSSPITGPYQRFNLKAGNNGTLLLYYDYTQVVPYPIGSGSWKTSREYLHTLTREDENHATMTWTYTESVDGSIQDSEKYSLRGIRKK